MESFSDDVRLELVPLRMEESRDAALAELATSLRDFEGSKPADGNGRGVSFDLVELDMGNVEEGVTGNEAIGANPIGSSVPAVAEQRVDVWDKGGGRESNNGRERGGRELNRVKTEANDVSLRESLFSETRVSYIYNDMRERGVGLVSDEDFEREFGASASGGSGQSTPKRRNGSRGRSNGASRLDVEGSFNTVVLKANAVDLSPGSKLGKDHGVPFLEEEVVSGLRSSTSNPVTSTILKTLFYVLVWYTFSTCLTLYNKLLLGEKRGNFPAPLLMNTIHFSMQAIISTLVVRFWCGTKTSIRMSWKDYFLRVVPTAGATALDIDLSNISLVYISVSFATMCKSGAPVFILLFAFAFKLEVPSFKLLGIIVVISFGVMLTVAKETEFELRGFILVMLATVMSGFRWTVTQLLLQKEEYGLSNPFAAMSYLTPVMAIITVVFSLALEPWHKLGSTPYFNTSRHIFESCALMLLGGALAFFMVMAEYLLIAETSAVTLTIAGVIKEIVTIVVVVFFLHEEFTWLKGLGLVIIVFGVGLFNWFKYQKLVEGSLNNGASYTDGTRSPLKYVILKDELAELEDDTAHVS